MAATHDFRGRRRDLAIVFRNERTAREAARELGTETGSVYGLIKRMHAERMLSADSDPGPPTRGTQYTLTPDARIALEDALDKRQAAGYLADDQRVLVVSGAGVLAVQEVLADPALSAPIAWGAWIGEGWLLAMTLESDFFASQKLVAALEGAGCECQLGRVDGLQAGSRLREWADGHVERVGANR